MTTLAKPLSAGALDEYVRDIITTTLPAAADAAALATAIEAFDAGAAKQHRMRQVEAGLGQVSGRNLTIGQVLTLAITDAGSAYVADDKITVTTSTGSGASGRVTSVDGSGAILTIELTISGKDYAVTDTAATVASENGTGAVITVTVDNNEKKIIEDAFASLT